MFQVTRDDKLPTNICSECANEISKSYKFRLKYIESNQKLRKLIDQSDDETMSALHNIPPDTTKSRLKCNICSCSFATRSEYREHNRGHTTTQTKKNETFKVWQCDHCSSEFSTKKLKLKHETEHHSDNEPTIMIYQNDDKPMYDGSISPLPNVMPEVDVDFDETVFHAEPEMDFGIYSISNFDPLEVNDSDDSLLVPMDVKMPSPKLNYFNDTNNKWQCKACGEMFRTRDQLREHNQIHMAMKRLKKSATKKEQVKKVPAVMPGKAKWECQTCLLAFATRDLLRAHRRESCSTRRPDAGSEMLKDCDPVT